MYILLRYIIILYMIILYKKFIIILNNKQKQDRNHMRHFNMEGQKRVMQLTASNYPTSNGKKKRKHNHGMRMYYHI